MAEHSDQISGSSKRLTLQEVVTELRRQGMAETEAAKAAGKLPMPAVTRERYVGLAPAIAARREHAREPRMARAWQPPTPYVLPRRSSGRRLWRGFTWWADRVAGLLLLPLFHPKLRPVTLVLIAIVGIWSLDFSGRPAGSALSNWSRPWRDRAAFRWEERFEGRDKWSDPSALAPVDFGGVRIQGLVLHKRTMALGDYEMSFSARADKRTIGWVVHATDPGNYRAFKLTRRRGHRAGGSAYELARYPVMAGQAPSRSSLAAVPLVARLPADEFLDITVRAAGQRVFTLVNGYGVDTWQDPNLKAGALGFLAENGETFVVKALVVSGNDDFVGHFLAGADETLRNLASLTATLYLVPPEPAFYKQ